MDFDDYDGSMYNTVSSTSNDNNVNNNNNEDDIINSSLHTPMMPPFSSSTDTNATVFNSSTSTSTRKNNMQCKQCLKRFNTFDLKISKFPKENFKLNQNKRKDYGGAIKKEYLVCNDCYRFPECISCKCKVKTSSGLPFFCESHSELPDPPTEFVNTGKCYHCIKKSTEGRRNRGRKQENMYDTVPTMSNDNKRTLRNMLNVTSLDQGNFGVDNTNWKAYSAFQFQQLWNVCIMKAFDLSFTKKELENILRFVGAPAGGSSIQNLENALNLLQKNKRWLLKNFKMPMTCYGINFSKVLQFAGVHHALYVTNDVQLSPQYIKIQKIQRWWRRCIIRNRFKKRWELEQRKIAKALEQKKLQKKLQIEYKKKSKRKRTKRKTYDV